MGRLDHLVEAVYDRFKDRYFKDESAFLSAIMSSSIHVHLQRSSLRLRVSSKFLSASSDLCTYPRAPQILWPRHEGLPSPFQI